jgi:anti-sigma factor RsiW
MNACERHQIEISALLDGESTPAAAIRVLDHLTGCPACRSFYGEVRSFHDLVSDLRDAGDAGTAPHRRSRPRRRTAAMPRWTWGLAAVLALAVGWWGVARFGPAADPAGVGAAPVTIELGGDAGRMDDARFVEMTRELLQADRRYHRMMLGLLTALDGDGGGAEGTPRFAVLGAEDGDTERPGEWTGHVEPSGLAN